MAEPIVAVVLAAGKGTRMESDLPKVLVPVCGRPMIHFVLDALRQAGVAENLVVVGYRADLVRQALASHPDVRFVDQPEQLGTGHAVKMCADALRHHQGPVVVLAGDSPLTQPASLRKLLDAYRRHRPACVLGTLEKDNPQGLGRILRDPQGNFQGIVEEKDATPEQLGIREVNMSTYVFDCRQLLPILDRLQNSNRQGEYYITDAPGLLRADGQTVLALKALQPCEALSINTMQELQLVEAELRRMGYA